MSAADATGVRPAPTVVLCDAGDAEGWATAVAARGFTVRALDPDGPTPTPGGGDGDAPVVWWVEVDGDEGTVAAAALRAALAGVVLVVGCGDGAASRRCARDVARATTVVDRRAQRAPLAGADVMTVRALAAIGEGATVAGAARQLGLSVRTLHRRLGDARDGLGVSTNSAAALALAQALHGLPRA